MNWLKKIFRTADRAPAARPASRLKLEALEDRLALSGNLIARLPFVDGSRASEPGRSAARSDAGTVVQISEDGDGLRYRLFNSSGGLLRTGTVPGTDPNRDYEPTVAMANNGRFVIAWTHVWSYSPYDLDVRAQVFDAGGNAVGGTLGVATSNNLEDEPAAGMDAYGNFAVAYRYAYSPTDHDVYASSYNSTGQLLGTAAVAVSASDDGSPSVAMNRSGEYVVAFTSTWAGSTSVYESTYNIWSQQLGSAWVFYGDSPSAAIDAQGNVGVAFRFDDAGVGQVYVEEYTATGQWREGVHAGWGGENQYSPSLAMADDGRFVVAYMDDDWVVPSQTGVYAEEYSASGVQLRWIDVAYGPGYNSLPTVAMTANGGFAVDYFYNNGSTIVQGDSLYGF
jgi:hypothetical protein